MSVTLSSRTTFSISRDSGATWTDFPKLPNGYQPQPMYPPDQRVDGTKNVPMFWNLTLTFNVLTQDYWRQINNLYQVSNQIILLNYLSNYDAVVAGKATPQWVYAPAVFADQPEAGDWAGDNIKQVTVQFTQVEWYLQ